MKNCNQCDEEYVDILDMEADEFLEFQLTEICHKCQRFNRGEDDEALINELEFSDLEAVIELEAFENG
jgi:hypothetical protein